MGGNRAEKRPSEAESGNISSGRKIGMKMMEFFPPSNLALKGKEKSICTVPTSRK